MVIFSGRKNRRRNGGDDGALAIPAILPPNTNGRWPNGNYGVGCFDFVAIVSQWQSASTRIGRSR